MMSKADKVMRDERDGRYTHSLDAVCKCGARKGQHLAKAPYALEETNCQGFRRAK